MSVPRRNRAVSNSYEICSHHDWTKIDLTPVKTQSFQEHVLMECHGNALIDVNTCLAILIISLACSIHHCLALLCQELTDLWYRKNYLFHDSILTNNLSIDMVLRTIKLHG